MVSADLQGFFREPCDTAAWAGDWGTARAVPHRKPKLQQKTLDVVGAYYYCAGHSAPVALVYNGVNRNLLEEH